MARDGWRWKDSVDALEHGPGEVGEMSFGSVVGNSNEIVYKNFEEVAEVCGGMESEVDFV